MDPTVTTTDPPGETLAARLAMDAAHAAAGPVSEPAVVTSRAQASLALSVAEIARVAATLAERQQPEAETVPGQPATLAEFQAAPLGAVATVPQGAIPWAGRKVVLADPGADNSSWYVVGVDTWTTSDYLASVGACLSPPSAVPAPFVRSVDELDDDEIRAVVREVDDRARQVPLPEWWYERGIYDGIAGRLRTPGTSPAPNLRPPEPAKPAARNKREYDATRDVLIGLALRAAAEAPEYGGQEGTQVSTRLDVDQAAREHVTALDGPAADLSTGPRRLAVTATLDATPGPVDGMPWLALRIGAMDGKGVALVQAYDPSALAPGSVVVAGGKAYVCLCSADLTAFRWAAVPNEDVHADSVTRVSDGNVPTDGVLVVDGSALGGGR